MCGDETCSSCPRDCGVCPTRSEAQIFTEPISMIKDEELRQAGYVIVRYYYAQNCQDCREPADVEAQLKKLASDYSDIIVLLPIDSTKYPYDAKRYAEVAGIVYKPTIRLDGIKGGQPGYDMLFGYSLVQKLQDGDAVNDVVPLICAHSDKCRYEGGKIVRSS